MKLIKPIFRKGNVYTDADTIRPRGAVIADTRKVIDATGDYYSAMVRWISGCIESYNGEQDPVTDQSQIKAITRQLSYRSAEALTIDLAMSISESDEIETVTNCPRCHKQIIFENIYDEDDELISENADSMADLSKIYYEGQLEKEPLFLWELEFPVEIYSGNGKGKEIDQKIESANLHYPTLTDCIEAFSSVGSSDEGRLQYRIYSNAIEEINNNPVDKKWRQRYGMKLFEKSEIPDLKNVFTLGRELGLDTNKKRQCPGCRKKWKEPLNPMNFFSSALQDTNI